MLRRFIWNLPIRSQGQLKGISSLRYFCWNKDSNSSNNNLNEEQLRQIAEERQKELEQLAKQAEEKERFNELFSIFAEKKQDEMRLVRFYKYYRKRYKKERMNMRTFLLLNLSLLILALIVPGKEYAVHRAFQMQAVRMFFEIETLIFKHSPAGFISPKAHINCLFTTLTYLDRNNIFDLDYIVSVIHSITLLINQQISQDNSKELMILGSAQNLTQLLKQTVELRPNALLERDLQETLLDYLEQICLNAAGLSNIRREFVGNKENLLNSETYGYYVLNQTNFSYLASISLAYNGQDKVLIYEFIETLLKNNLDYEGLLGYFLETSRMQVYLDIADKENKSLEAQRKAIDVVRMMFKASSQCRKRMVQDKLVSNMIKLFVVKQKKNQGLYKEALDEMIAGIAEDKELLALRDSQMFRQEFSELQKLAQDKVTKEMLKPIFK